MDAQDQSNYLQVAKRDQDYADEMWDEEIKRRARVEFQKRRDLILSMNSEAITATAVDFTDFAYDREGKVTRRFIGLIHSAFNCSSEISGREFVALLIESMNETAYQRAIESMERVEPVKRPIGDATRAALEAVHRALELRK